MPYSRLSVEQIQELLAEHPRMLNVPGVTLVMADFIGNGKMEVAVVATVYAGSHHEIWHLPVTVAGLPVVVKVEDRRTGRVLNIIDPRENNGVWPRANVNNRADK